MPAASCSASSATATGSRSRGCASASSADRSTGIACCRPRRGSEELPEVNYLAVLLCGVSSMVLGAIWYAPPVFGRAWQPGVGLSDETLGGGNMALIYGLAFLLSLAAAWVFALFLGRDMALGPSVVAGAAAGLFWGGAAFRISSLFEQRSPAMWLINGGYHTVQFTLFGLVLGLMR